MVCSLHNVLHAAAEGFCIFSVNAQSEKRTCTALCVLMQSFVPIIKLQSSQNKLDKSVRSSSLPVPVKGVKIVHADLVCPSP